jgi:hypothetical protein
MQPAGSAVHVFLLLVTWGSGILLAGYTRFSWALQCMFDALMTMPSGQASVQQSPLVPRSLLQQLLLALPRDFLKWMSLARVTVTTYYCCSSVGILFKPAG